MKQSNHMTKNPAAPRSKKTTLAFPKGFLWGTASAAHQVEGKNSNSWTEWEKQPGRIADGKRSGRACDHYNRFDRDFANLQRLHNNTHRLSLEWSRLEPKSGKWNDKEFAHYRRVLSSLKKRGLEPMLTLHHFTNPLWFEALGAFAHPESPEIFERFTLRAAEELGGPVRLWCTINEPVVYTHHSYMLGIWPPGRTDARLAFRVLGNLLRAHARAYRALHKVLGDGIQVGIAKHFRVFDPARPLHPGDRLMAKNMDFMFNRLAILALARGVVYPPLALWSHDRSLAGTLDFIGVNYYSREFVRFRPHRPDLLFGEFVRKSGLARNSLDWEIYPHGLYRILRYCARFGLPVYITENGIATEDDAQRTAYIASHLAAAHQAIADGVDVRGYYYWSNLDNFEWEEGYTARFGLYGVDFKTRKRALRESGRRYAEIAGRNTLAID
jgi:beta-glucosidase